MYRAALLSFAVLSGFTPIWVSAAESLGNKLADIDAGRLLPPDSAEVARAEKALDAAVKTCSGTTPIAIADRAVFIANKLHEDGIYSRPVDVLEGLTAIADEGTTAKGCDRLLAQYATTRQAMTHSGAVAGMRILFKAGIH